MMFEAHVTDEYRTRMSELLIVVAMLHYCAVSNLTDIIPCSDVRILFIRERSPGCLFR